MGGKIDIAKGRIEEAAGAVAGSEKLRNQGRKDQAVGKMKQDADWITKKTTKRVR